jgi:hypothetical protein
LKAMKRVPFIALLLATFGLGLALAGWLVTARGPAARETSGTRVIHAPRDTPATPRAFPTDEAMLTAIMSAAAVEDPLLRAHLLYEAVGRLSPGELARLYESALRVGDYRRRAALVSVLLSNWARLDPAAAAAAVRPMLERFRAMAAPICRAWRMRTAWTPSSPKPGRKPRPKRSSPRP